MKGQKFLKVTGILMIIGAALSILFGVIIGGVGAVLGFVPQMLILFVLLAMLEDCGYMARVAFILSLIHI